MMVPMFAFAQSWPQVKYDFNYPSPPDNSKYNQIPVMVPTGDDEQNKVGVVVACNERFLDITVIPKPFSLGQPGASLEFPRNYSTDMSAHGINTFKVIDVDVPPYSGHSSFLITCMSEYTTFRIVYILASIDPATLIAQVNSVHSVNLQGNNPWRLFPTSTEIVNGNIYTCGYTHFSTNALEPTLASSKEMFLSKWTGAPTAMLLTYNTAQPGGTNDYDMFWKLKYINNKLMVMGSMNRNVTASPNYSCALNAEVDLSTLALGNAYSYYQAPLSQANGNAHYHGLMSRDIVEDVHNTGTYYNLFMFAKDIAGTDVGVAHLEGNNKISVPAVFQFNTIRFTNSDFSALGYQLHSYPEFGTQPVPTPITGQTFLTISGAGQQYPFAPVVPLSYSGYFAYGGIFSGISYSHKGHHYKPNPPTEDPMLSFADQAWVAALPYWTNPPTAMRNEWDDPANIHLLQTGHYDWNMAHRLRMITMEYTGYNDCGQQAEPIETYEKFDAPVNPLVFNFSQLYFPEIATTTDFLTEPMDNVSYDCEGNVYQYRTTNIASHSKANHITLSPNPAQEVIKVSLPSNATSVKVIAMDGRVWYNEPILNQNQLTIKVDSWPRGVYTMYVGGNRNSVSVTKFTLN